MITTRAGGTRTIARAIALLRAFDGVQPAWRLAELARASRLHRATAHRLLAALETEGMVVHDSGSDLYRLGPEAIALGARALRATDLRAVSRAELQALAGGSGETATLEVLSGSDMLILDEVAGGALVGVTPMLGERWPVHATSTGKAILAALPAGERPRAAGRLARYTDHTVTNRTMLERELEATRRRGYAVAAEELELGYIAVGAAVRGHDGTPVAAVSIGGPSLRMTPRRITSLGRSVRDAAARISSALGHRAA